MVMKVTRKFRVFVSIRRLGERSLRRREREGERGRVDVKISLKFLDVPRPRFQSKLRSD